jgi:hypothetical protein
MDPWSNKVKGTRPNQELQALYVDLDIMRETGNKRLEWVGH